MFPWAIGSLNSVALAGFPLELEGRALQYAVQVRGDDPDLFVHLGRVTAKLTPGIEMRRR